MIYSQCVYPVIPHTSYTVNLLGHMFSAEMKCHHYIEVSAKAASGDIRSLCRASIFGASVVYLYDNI